MTHYKSFPFTAIVGQDLMRLALVLNAINPKIGGVLVKGTKGTAKSTAVRALADLLPDIPVVRGCAFNCNPMDPKECCHECQARLERGGIGADDIEWLPMKVIDLPINATEDRVVGTIDIKKVLADGSRMLEPGILADANRNILYIDEVNLLADNVTDVLLDSAAMGMNIVEREGVSIHHPASFILVGTMNPEEGELRPQLLDRFGLSVEVERITDVEKRVEIIRNAEEYQADPAAFHDRFKARQDVCRNRITSAREILSKVKIPVEMLRKIAEICIAFGTDGHRADITMNLTAKTLAARDNRTMVEDKDVRLAAMLALPHRLRRLPFEDTAFNEDLLEEVLEGREEEEPDGKEESLDEVIEPNSRESPRAMPSLVNTKQETFAVRDVKAVPLDNRPGKIREEMEALGRRVPHPTKSTRGKYTGSSKARGINIPGSTDVALGPTLAEAARDPAVQEAVANGGKITVTGEHLHLKRREGKSSYLMIFCVDSSGSMGVDRRMESVKGVILSILENSYVHRDKVALVVFKDTMAATVLPPTRSLDLARKLLQDIPTGGTTPLTAGLLKPLAIIDAEQRKETGYLPVVVIITDARGNVSDGDVLVEIEKAGREYAKRAVDAIVIDTEPAGIRLGLARKFASEAGARYHHLDSITQETIKDVLAGEGIN